jgi:hypothetical protein
MQLRPVDARCALEGVDAGAEQRFIHVDIPKSRDESLIEKQWFDAPVPLRQARRECSGRQAEKVWPQRRNLAPPNAPEPANVIVEENAVPETKRLARIGTGFSLQPKCARHPEPRHHPARLEIEDHTLSVAPHAPQRANGSQRAPRQFLVENARDGFSFGKLRH